MNNSKVILAAALAGTMLLSLTACDESVPAASNGDGTPATNAATVATTVTTTTYETDPHIQDAVGGITDKLDNPDLDVSKRIKWMAWWDMDETTAAGELFKSVYGIPTTGDDPDRDGRIFEYITVAYGERYDKLATAIQSGDSPDLFPFELRDFPYGVLKGRYQAFDDIVDFSSSKWDSVRDIMSQFELGGKTYMAINQVTFDSFLYYRQSVIDDLSAGDPREMFDNNTWTWDSFLTLARAFQQSGDSKFCIDGWSPTNQFILSTGVPLVGSDGNQIVNNLYDPAVERAEELLATLQKENLRYPRHELNGWSINYKAWVSGDTLFWANGGTWEFEETLSKYASKSGWDDDEIKIVPFPRDPSADKYYHSMQLDAYTWVKGSENPDGVAAWIDCCVTANMDPAVTEASKQQQQEKYGWNSDNLDFVYSLIATDGTSPLTPAFDFKNGLGEDIASASSADVPVEQLTEYVYITGSDSYTQLRETNNATIQARIDEINAALAKN